MRDRAFACILLPAVLAMATSLSGCKEKAAATPDQRLMTLRVESPGIQQGEDIPRQFTCDGAGLSPALSWQPPPDKTMSVALIASDPDAPSGTFIHWVLYNLPPGTRNLPQGISADKQLPDGSRQGVNSADSIGYYAPCPPGGAPHRYFFTVYALDRTLDLPPGANEEQLMKAMSGHILAFGQLMGRYRR